MPVCGAQICPFYVSVFEIAVIKQERNAIWEGCVYSFDFTHFSHNHRISGTTRHLKKNFVIYTLFPMEQTGVPAKSQHLKTPRMYQREIVHNHRTLLGNL